MSGLFLYNGRFYTMEKEGEVHNSCYIEAGLIKKVGSKENIEKFLPACVNKIDLEGATVTPGLVDGHAHFLHYSLSLREIELSRCLSIEEAVNTVREGLEEEPSRGSWYIGRGWNKNNWGGRWPSRYDLDPITGDKPAAFFSQDFHCLWVNTAVLKTVGIDSSTVSPPGGEIVKDSAGQPTGLFKEDAISLVRGHIPVPSLEDAISAIKKGMEVTARLGLTGIHNYEDGLTTEALIRLSKKEQLLLRFLLGIPYKNLENAISLGIETGFGSDYLKYGHIKIILDGTLGSETAAMLEPYRGSSSAKGIQILTDDYLNLIIKKAVKAGFPLAIHAIGDRANKISLDILAQIKNESKRLGLRHRIEHAQLLRPEDVQRFAELSIIPSMQPVHLKGDKALIDEKWGKPRSEGAYLCKSLLNTGVPLVLGSDAPVESIDPLEGIEYAVNRNGFNKHESLTTYEAVLGYTKNSAFAAGEEKVRGTIQAGKQADLTFYSHDFIKEPSLLAKAEIIGAMVGGKLTYFYKSD